MYFVYLVIEPDLLELPFMHDPQLFGGLQLCGPGDAAAIFPSKADARKAIKISTLSAQLEKLKGMPYDDAFIENRKSVKLRKVDMSACD